MVSIRRNEFTSTGRNRRGAVENSPPDLDVKDEEEPTLLR